MVTLPGAIAPGMAPGVAAPVDIPQPQVARTNDDRYEDAVVKRDPDALLAFARDNVDNDDGAAAVRAANVIKQNREQAQQILVPIAQAGGLQTPEGRVAISNTWKTVKDDPRYKDAFIGMLLGDPNAYKYITGGQVTTKITYDDLGRQLEEKVNDLGERVKVIDVLSQRELSPEEYASRRGGQSSLANTKARLREMETEKANRDAFNLNEKVTGAYSAASPELFNKNKQRIELLESIPDLTKEQREFMFSFANRVIGTNQSLSKAAQTLKQFSSTKDESTRQQMLKEAQGAAGLFGLKIGGNNQLLDADNNSVSQSQLEQLSNQITDTRGFDQRFQQTREEIFKSQQYKSLTPEQKQAFDAVMKLTGEIERKNTELMKEGKEPAFLITPANVEITDPNAIMVVQSLTGMMNAEAIAAFQAWKKDQLPAYERANKTPSPYELETAFARSDIYKNIQKKYSDKAQEILSRPIKTVAPQGSVEALPGGINTQAPNLPAAAPATAAPAGAKAPPARTPAKPKRQLADIFK